MKRLLMSALLFLTCMSVVMSQDWTAQRQQQDRERAAYWKAKGYDFNPDIYTAYAMDRKVVDIERAKYWKSKGYDFNPDIMTAWSMDQEVQRKTSVKEPVSTESRYKSASVASSSPRVAENGDIRGLDNDGDGRTEPVYVRGYTRSDGTYVRGHYRATPSTTSSGYTAPYTSTPRYTSPSTTSSGYTAPYTSTPRYTSPSTTSAGYSYDRLRSPSVAENGDIRGLDNDGDGRTEPVYVRGYTRSDGTYVGSHYRASPRK